MRDMKLPAFFPDATRAVLRTVDSVDIENTKTPGILVNTFHLYQGLGEGMINKYGGVKKFMNWKGPMISDSGGFQVMSVIKKSGKGAITDEGVIFPSDNKEELLLTPEDSIAFQFALGTDLMVVLDDFTDINATEEKAKETVERTIAWAKRSKDEFVRQVKKRGFTEENRPLLIGVVQGGNYLELRKYCAEKLIEIGFDGFGYGGWPINKDGSFNYDVAQVIADSAPDGYLLYGLGVGKPHEIVKLHQMGYTIFDCVLPTRDARHGRLYVYDADSIDEIDVYKEDFYSYFNPTKALNKESNDPVSKACDCLLCTNYSRAYLHHLWKIKETSALRLSTIHNLRFYSLLMEKLHI